MFFSNRALSGWKFTMLGLLFSSLVTLAGCGGGNSGPELGTVTGVVTLDGEPLADAVVSFAPAEGRASLGTTDQSGRYVLDYTYEKKGAVIGEHVVSITTQRDAFSDESGAGKDVPAREEMLPVRYHAQTELKATVKPGANTIDFQLESGGPTQVPQQRKNSA